jgi:hypothetical protein
VTPLGGTAPASRRTDWIAGPPGAAFAGLTSEARYASRSWPLDVQSSSPSGDASTHIALGISAGSSFTWYWNASVAGSATPIEPVSQVFASGRVG